MGNEAKQVVLLGIDPGLQVTGYAILRQDGRSVQALEFDHLILTEEKEISKRIQTFYAFFLHKIDQYKVTHIALETPFLGKNVQAFLKLGYLRGIIYLLAEQQGAFLHEFSPTQVKVSVTGFGGASKEQVALMIKRLFPGLAKADKKLRTDVTDALAIALCGIWNVSSSHARKMPQEQIRRL